MPQDGSNNYQYPPGTPGIPDTTIESEAYNTFLDDLVTNDLNIARPIHRGGTGATTAHQALINLNGEEAKQQVTNYDTFAFVCGSFYSVAGATSAPTANGFTGISYVDATGNITVEAREVTSSVPGNLYVRQKQGGTWGAWALQSGSVADLDTKYVNVTGDTMTGQLTATTLTALGNVISTATSTTGGLVFGNPANGQSIAYDGTYIRHNGANCVFGTVDLSVAAPVCTGTVTSGTWALGVSGNNRGAIYLALTGSNIYAYFCQESTSINVGSITGTNVATSYNTASSGELKEDLKSFDAGNIIDKTNVYDFSWKRTGERSFGVIAQQAIDVYPLAVTHIPEVEGSEYWGVDYSKYVPVLLQELKALRQRVADLEGGSTAKPSKPSK